MNLLRSLYKEESGQDLIEYALLALLVTMGTVAVLPTIGSDVSKEFSKIGAQLT